MVDLQQYKGSASATSPFPFLIVVTIVLTAFVSSIATYNLTKPHVAATAPADPAAEMAELARRHNKAQFDLSGKSRDDALKVISEHVNRRNTSETCTYNGYVNKYATNFCLARNGYVAFLFDNKLFKVLAPDEIVRLDPEINDIHDDRYLDPQAVLAAFE